MPNEVQAITPEFAAEQLLDCYKRGGSENVLESTLQRLEDPIQPVSDEGKRRLHPLLWTAVFLVVCFTGVFVYFTVKR